MLSIQLEVVFIESNFNEVIVPSIYEKKLFADKAGKELSDQMWSFINKDNKECCLIPEVTGILQDQFNKKWWYEYKKKPLKLFYVNRCYRYDKPQKGRYREFTQLGIEVLGGSENYEEYTKDLLRKILYKFNIKSIFKENVKRGINYYTENGFEVECNNLGAQKQIAGGGSYLEGVGWAIGIDRLVLSILNE
jgi:histidyl-tRNA synthetase